MYKGDCSVKIFNLSNWTAIELLFLSFYVLKINAPVERLYRVFSVLNLYLRTLCIVGTVHVKQGVARLQCNAASRVIRLYDSFLFFWFYTMHNKIFWSPLHRIIHEQQSGVFLSRWINFLYFKYLPGFGFRVIKS